MHPLPPQHPPTLTPGAPPRAQTTARRNDWPLDRTVLVTEVTKRPGPEAVEAPSRDGAFVHGLWMEGASWCVCVCLGGKGGAGWRDGLACASVSRLHCVAHAAPPPLPAMLSPCVCAVLCRDDKAGVLDDPRPKQLFAPMPVLLVRAVPAEKAEARDVYQCPGARGAWRGGSDCAPRGGVCVCVCVQSAGRAARAPPTHRSPSPPPPLHPLLCPVYATEARFRQEVFTAQLRTKQPWTRWALAGAALFLDVA